MVKCLDLFGAALFLKLGHGLSLRPFGAPPSQREVFRQAGPPFDKGGFFFLAHFSIFFALFDQFQFF